MNNPNNIVNIIMSILIGIAFILFGLKTTWVLIAVGAISIIMGIRLIVLRIMLKKKGE